MWRREKGTSWHVWDQRSRVRRAYRGTRPSWPQCLRAARRKRCRRNYSSGDPSWRFWRSGAAEIRVWVRIGWTGRDLGNAEMRDRPRGRSRRWSGNASPIGFDGGKRTTSFRGEGVIVTGLLVCSDPMGINRSLLRFPPLWALSGAVSASERRRLGFFFFLIAMTQKMPPSCSSFHLVYFSYFFLSRCYRLSLVRSMNHTRKK